MHPSHPAAKQHSLTSRHPAKFCPFFVFIYVLEAIITNSKNQMWFFFCYRLLLSNCNSVLLLSPQMPSFLSQVLCYTVIQKMQNCISVIVHDCCAMEIIWPNCAPTVLGLSQYFEKIMHPAFTHHIVSKYFHIYVITITVFLYVSNLFTANQLYFTQLCVYWDFVYQR